MMGIYLAPVKAFVSMFLDDQNHSSTTTKLAFEIFAVINLQENQKYLVTCISGNFHDTSPIWISPFPMAIP